MAVYKNDIWYKGTLGLVNMHASGPASQLDATALNPVGIVTRYNGNLYRYVLLNTGTDTVATVAGAPAYWHTLTPAQDVYTVTSDASSAYASGVNTCAGVFLAAAQTTAYYIWILIAGVYAGVVVDNTAAAGDRLYGGSDSTFTHFDAASTGVELMFGVCLEAEGATTSGIAKSLIYPKNLW
jgi:hypothetical protein